MGIDVFNRYENKYRLDEETFVRLQDRLSGFMRMDAYNQGKISYPICNIYYDTADSYLIRASLRKPAYKEKLRLRSYGTPAEGSAVYVEIKKKFRGVTNKRRSEMRPEEAYEFLTTGNLPVLRPYMNGQVLREAQYILTRQEIKPMAYLAYERRAFFGDENSDLRVSFDTNIITRRHDLRLEAGIYGEQLLRQGEWLMEIKTSRAIPIWLTRLLSEYKVYPQSFSKYGAEYQRTFSVPSVSAASSEIRIAAIRPIQVFTESVPAFARA
jgi:hypothetical protein